MPDATPDPVPDDTLRFIVRSELMENCTTARALSGAGKLSSAVDRDGTVQVFSIGTVGDLYNIFPNPNSDTGWSVVPLRAPGKVAYMAVGRDLTGAVVVLAGGTDGHVYWISDERWASWIDLGVPFGSLSLKGLKVGLDGRGELLAMALVNNPATGSDAVIRIYWRNTTNPWDYCSQFIVGEIYDFVPGAVPLGTGAFTSAASTLNNAAQVSFFAEHERLLFAYCLQKLRVPTR